MVDTLAQLSERVEPGAAAVGEERLPVRVEGERAVVGKELDQAPGGPVGRQQHVDLGRLAELSAPRKIVVPATDLARAADDAHQRRPGLWIEAHDTRRHGGRMRVQVQEVPAKAHAADLAQRGHDGVGVDLLDLTTERPGRGDAVGLQADVAQDLQGPRDVGGEGSFILVRRPDVLAFGQRAHRGEVERLVVREQLRADVPAGGDPLAHQPQEADQLFLVDAGHALVDAALRPRAGYHGELAGRTGTVDQVGKALREAVGHHGHVACLRIFVPRWVPAGRRVVQQHCNRHTIARPPDLHPTCLPVHQHLVYMNRRSF